MRLKTLKSEKQVSFKKRGFNKISKNRFIFGNSMLILTKNSRFEVIYFEIFRKFLKNILKKKNLKKNNKNYWIFLRVNTPITKKTKNSRMGKGKGFLYRWLIRLPRGFKLLECRDINYFRLNFFTKKWSKKINLPIIVKSKIFF